LVHAVQSLCDYNYDGCFLYFFCFSFTVNPSRFFQRFQSWKIFIGNATEDFGKKACLVFEIMINDQFCDAGGAGEFSGGGFEAM